MLGRPRGEHLRADRSAPGDVPQGLRHALAVDMLRWRVALPEIDHAKAQHEVGDVTRDD